MLYKMVILMLEWLVLNCGPLVSEATALPHVLLPSTPLV